MMASSRTLAVLLSVMLAVAAAAPQHVRARRQLADDNTLQPIEDADTDEQTREKRKLEGITQAKFGVKNAVLGFVFGKINSIIDAKTRLVENLDKQNIAINKQYGIEPPSQGGLASLSGIVGQVLTPKLQLLGPKIQAVSSLFGGSSGSGGSEGGAGSGFGSLLSVITSLSGSSIGGGASAGGTVETVDSSEEEDDS